MGSPLPAACTVGWCSGSVHGGGGARLLVRTRHYSTSRVSLWRRRLGNYILQLFVMFYDVVIILCFQCVFSMWDPNKIITWIVVSHLVSLDVYPFLTAIPT